MVQDTLTRVRWSRKSRDTSTQDNSDETQLDRWFVLNFGTNFVVPNCLGAEVSCGQSVRLPIKIHKYTPHLQNQDTATEDFPNLINNILIVGKICLIGGTSSDFPVDENENRC